MHGHHSSRPRGSGHQASASERDALESLELRLSQVRAAATPEYRYRYAARLRQDVEMRAKSINDPTLFGRYMDAVTAALGAMSKVADFRCKLGCIAVIDELIDVSCRGADRKHFQVQRLVGAYPLQCCSCGAVPARAPRESL